MAPEGHEIGAVHGVPESRGVVVAGRGAEKVARRCAGARKQTPGVAQLFTAQLLALRLLPLQLFTAFLFPPSISAFLDHLGEKVVCELQMRDAEALLHTDQSPVDERANRALANSGVGGLLERNGTSEARCRQQTVFDENS